MDAAWALPESPYDLLGVADDCSTADVKKAYRDMARLFHPDRNTDAQDIESRTAHFLKIKKAYETLQDPGSRKLHDAVHQSKVSRRVFHAIDAAPDSLIDFHTANDCTAAANCVLSSPMRFSSSLSVVMAATCWASAESGAGAPGSLEANCRRASANSSRSCATTSTSFPR